MKLEWDFHLLTTREEESCARIELSRICPHPWSLLCWMMRLGSLSSMHGDLTFLKKFDQLFVLFGLWITFSSIHHHVQKMIRFFPMFVSITGTYLRVVRTYRRKKWSKLEIFSPVSYFNRKTSNITQRRNYHITNS